MEEMCFSLEWKNEGLMDGESGDDESDELWLALPSAILNPRVGRTMSSNALRSIPVSSPVHVFMLSIHEICGLTLVLLPRSVPWMAAFSKQRTDFR